MENYNGSRSEKIMEAKQAFTNGRVEKEYDESRGYSWGIFRFLAAGFVFVVCFICLQTDGTIFGIEKEKVIEAISDEKYWDGFLKKAGEFANIFLNK